MSIKVESLTKLYEQQKAIDSLSFEVNKGEIVGFLGPNGAGKSTTMKICTGFLSQTSGEAYINGIAVSEDSLACQRAIGYLPEHNPLYLEDYVKEYLRFSASIYKLSSKEITKRVGEVIDLCGLEREQHKKIGALSKGYRQRVGLAQALIHDPDVLILDEPTTGLDPNQIIEIREVIKQVSKDKTVVFSTHIMQEVEALCERVIIINQGQLVANEKVDQLVKKKDHKLIHLTFKQAIDSAKLEAVEGVSQCESTNEHEYQLAIKGEFSSSPLLALIAKEQWELQEMKQSHQSLEEIFGQLTNN